ncbi:LamG domain-containing protein [Salegentibacter sp. F14]
MKKFLLYFFLIWSIVGSAQQGSKAPVIARTGFGDLKENLQKGYEAFQIEKSEFNSSTATVLSNYLQEHKGKKLILFIQENDIAFYKQNFATDIQISENILMYGNQDAQLYLVTREDFHSHFDFFELKEHDIEGNTSCKKFNWVCADSLNNSEAIEDIQYNLTEKFGIVPDFIHLQSISDLAELQESFARKPLYKAVVLFNGEELNNIGWKEYPGLETCGIFRTQDSTLTPQKRGFMFSPDIYNFTDKNTRINGPKIFRAYKYELKEKLRYSLPLEEEVINLAHPEDKSTHTDLEFIKDPHKGLVADFNGVSSYIDIRSVPEGELEELSISAWIKPSEVSGSYSLIGKGEAFSAKIFNGRLRFTTPGIKDHTTSKPIIKPDVWSHIALVYIPGKELYFYLNGELIESVPASDIEQTDHALLIGTNLWGQYYAGLLSELNIWDRALNDQEIKEVYQSMNTSAKEENPWLMWIPISLLFVVPILLLGKKWFNKNGINKKVYVPDPLPHTNKNSLILLNGFKVWNNRGEDMTYKFSPKRKELIILILIYTIKEGGISSKKMSEILWPGFTSQSKKNNRSTQIKEIRKIFEDNLSIEIGFKDKKWQILKGPEVSIDIFKLQELAPHFLSAEPTELKNKPSLLEFSRIVARGPLLPQMEYEWLDQLKSEYNNAILDLLTPHLESSPNYSTSELLDIINAILVIDPLFETAIKRKVECLLKEGRHMSARKVIENYKRQYEILYNENIDPEFLKLVKES